MSQNLGPSIHVWEPIPPGPEFAAIGMVVTAEDEEPEPQEVHCVPKPWVQSNGGSATKVWSCPGAAPPASFWTSGTLFWVSTGAAAQVAPSIQVMPSGKFYASLHRDNSKTSVGKSGKASDHTSASTGSEPQLTVEV